MKIYPDNPAVRTFQNLPVRVIWHHVKNYLADQETDGKAESCVIWRGPKNRAGGGRVNVGSTVVIARRFVFALHRGALEPNRFVRVTCENPDCLNPAHLEAYKNVVGKDTDLLVERCAALYRENLDINQIARLIRQSRSWTEQLLKLARDAKLLLPVEAEGVELAPDEVKYFRDLGYAV